MSGEGEENGRKEGEEERADTELKTKAPHVNARSFKKRDYLSI